MNALQIGLAALALLAACERTQSEQRGYRGLGLVQVRSPATVAQLEAVNTVPRPLRKANPNGPLAADEFQNVQVMGDLSRAEFARLMLSIKSWVAPEEGCDYCHQAPDYASDAKYTKRVAREMLRMTRHINRDWQAHVKGTGVTCYTCHRGHPVPPKVWNQAVTMARPTLAYAASPMRLPTPSAADSALPLDALDDFLLRDKAVAVAGTQALRSGVGGRSIADTRSSYALMTVMAESLGVNCTYCHNSRAFYDWTQSPPQRTQALYGIHMARDLNKASLQPLAGLLPPERLGPAGDVPKVYCATCHMGSGKPLNGVPMVRDFPELVGSKQQWAEAAALAASVARPQ